MHCVSIRRYAHVCGVNPMEDLVQQEMFHLLMGQAADPPMYVLTYAYKAIDIYDCFMVIDLCTRTMH